MQCHLTGSAAFQSDKWRRTKEHFRVFLNANADREQLVSGPVNQKQIESEFLE